MINRILLLVCIALFFLQVRSQDRQLGYFLQQGIINSPLISDLNGQLQSNQIDSLLIRAMNKPRVEFRGYAFYAPVVNNIGYSEILTNIANLTSVMSVSQQIFNKKTLEANLVKTGIQGRSLANTIRITEKDLKKVITASYIDAWSAFSDLSVSREFISFAKEQGNILKSLTENGIYKQTDYLAFMIDIQGQELQLQEQKMNFRKQVSDLYLLCGIKDTATFSPVQPELEDGSFSREKANPFLMRFFIDSLRISNEHLLLDRNYKPAVGWFSDAGLINNDPKVIYQNFGLSIGLNLTMPVYDGNQRKLNHRKLKTEEAIRSGYAAAYKKEYDLQVQQLTVELKQTRELLPAVRSQISNAEMLVNQEKELVGRGSGSITEYLIAVKNHLSVRKIINQYEARIMQIRNEINYLTY